MTPEQQMGRGVITIGEKRSGNDGHNNIAQQALTDKVDTNKIRSDNEGVRRFSQDEDVKVTISPKIICLSCFMKGQFMTSG